MQRFFLDFDSLNQFTLPPQTLGDQLKCPHCSKTRQRVSHGKMHRQESSGRSVIAGKRVFCSNRAQHVKAVGARFGYILLG